MLLSKKKKKMFCKSIPMAKPLDMFIPRMGTIWMSIGLIILRDRGWWPQWDEAFTKSIGVDEAMQ